MSIGKIIKSNSHLDYVCQVHGPGEVEVQPAPEDYALGTWVRIPAGSERDSYAVGLIYDTQLYNPDYGTFGPRLSSQQQIEVFAPDYLNETAVLLGVLVLGQMRGNTRVASGFCPVAAEVGAAVSRMEEDEIRAFHSGRQGLEIGYYSLLLSMGDPILPPLLLSVLDRLEQLMVDHAPVIHSLRSSLSWNTHVNLAR